MRALSNSETGEVTIVELMGDPHSPVDKPVALASIKRQIKDCDLKLAALDGGDVDLADAVLDLRLAYMDAQEFVLSQ